MMQRTLHILNGKEMYHYFQKTHYLGKELMIPFNEAMCFGDTCEDLFSAEFTDIRSKVHHVTPEIYAEITLKPLQPLFSGNFSRMALWFDSDMFCQINLLTVLAWLDHTNYEGELTLHIVGEKFEPLRSFTLNKVEGYYELYKQVLIHREAPMNIALIPLKEGIELYLNYLHKDSDLLMFIERHPDVPEEELVSLLIEKFRDYGLGDTQYLEIIKSLREKL
ncbi:AraC family transcriptional regulator [Ammoniphilus resinae]|uniref:AraC family transcriptional regulator n=1 Tax=Ammoniphilus resinae TaxID=861532 RepID=A0ABS4GSD4_9BACL|nr:AraC family transcriptional regulator [Ammoniphilus resinae]MBP1933195.1 hypothetical protein [Ammoniphilus resinae]